MLRTPTGAANPPRCSACRRRAIASTTTLDRLYALRIYVERELTAGPWDAWDAWDVQVLEQWLAIAKEQIRAANAD